LDTTTACKKLSPGFGYDYEFGGATDWEDYLNNLDGKVKDNVYKRTNDYGIANKVCDIWECKNNIGSTESETTTQTTDGVETTTTTSYDIPAGAQCKEKDASGNYITQSPGLPLDVPENLSKLSLPQKEG